MKVFSFDFETNGLWGRVFAAAAVVRENGVEIARFLALCPIRETVDPWVLVNVLSRIEKIGLTHGDDETMLKDFAEFYITHKDGADIIAHMAIPVESTVIRDMHNLGYIGDWDAPYPLIDLAGCLKMADEDPTSVDAYATKYDIIVPKLVGGTHNPLYDSIVTALVYEHLMSRAKKVKI